MIIRGIDPIKPSVDILRQASEILRSDGVVMAPTETKYGLLVRTDNIETVKKLYKIKNRDLNNPTAIFVKSVENIPQYGTLNDISRRLAEQFYPGPITLIMNANDDIQQPLAVDGKIGIRCSSSKVISGLLNLVDFDLTATSANKSGGDELETIDEAVDVFGDEIDLYLDSGCLKGVASTVVDCTTERYAILRQGTITPAMINKALEVN